MVWIRSFGRLPSSMGLLPAHQHGVFDKWLALASWLEKVEPKE